MISLEISFYSGYINYTIEDSNPKKMYIIVCLQNALN